MTNALIPTILTISTIPTMKHPPLSLAVALAAAAASAGTDFEIRVDLDAAPIRDARASSCFPMIG